MGGTHATIDSHSIENAKKDVRNSISDQLPPYRQSSTVYLANSNYIKNL
jgi:hypothetical protein